MLILFITEIVVSRAIITVIGNVADAGVVLILHNETLERSFGKNRLPNFSHG